MHVKCNEIEYEAIYGGINKENILCTNKWKIDESILCFTFKNDEKKRRLQKFQ